MMRRRDEGRGLCLYKFGEVGGPLSSTARLKPSKYDMTEYVTMTWGKWGPNSDRHLPNQGNIVRSTLGRPRLEDLILHLVTYPSENCRWRLDE